MHLVDPVPLHVEQAQALAKTRDVSLAGAEVGDARALRLPDESTDAVLMLSVALRTWPTV